MQVFSQQDPAHPLYESSSNFPVTHFGDTDYDLRAYVMCDECRYAMFDYYVQTVFADLGNPTSSSKPIFTNYHRDLSIGGIPGGFTFKSGSVQYLITSGLSDQCGSGAALYVFDSTDPAVIASKFRGCVQDNSGNLLPIKGGLYLQDDRYNSGQPYLWLSNGGWVFAFQVQGSDNNVQLVWKKTLTDLKANVLGSHTLGMAVDTGHDVAVSVRDNFLNVWDFPTRDFTMPRKLVSVNVPYNITLALSYPLVWTSALGTGAFGHTFNISGALDTVNPVVEDIAFPDGVSMSFWDPSQPWNNAELLDCTAYDQGATFSADGTHLYNARWVKLQNYDVSGCGGPQVPVAHVSAEILRNSHWVSLVENPFPGDRIRIFSSSTGEIATTNLSLKDASGAAVGDLDQDGTYLEYTIPTDTPSSYYTAGVEVFNSTGESDSASLRIQVDLTPEATISYEPAAPLVGDELAFGAMAEGTPDMNHPTGNDHHPEDAFVWTITAPGGRTTTYYGRGDAASPIWPEDPLSLSTSGTWTIDLKVFYEHSVGGNPYKATAEEVLEISSVAAAIAVSPTHPVNTEDIVLDGTESRWAGETEPAWKWEYRSTGGAWNELTSCANQDTCTIEGDEDNPFLPPGDYEFKLTLSLDGEYSSATAGPLTVADGTINIDFSISDTNPDIGQQVIFNITGVGSVESVDWDFGGPGCTDRVWTCTPTVTNCKSGYYTYTTSGSKTVRMTVHADGQTYPAVSHQLTVSTSGTVNCGGGGGTTCSYTVSPSSLSFDEQGGSKTFSVSTSSGCAWTASETSSWLSISPTSGNGPGSVTVHADVNAGTAQRSTTVRIAGENHSVRQDGNPCEYVVHPGSLDIPAAGGSGYSIWVGTSSTCSWTASSSAAWVRIETGTGSGTGNGVVKYDVQENTGGRSRSATVTIQGHTHTITQAAPYIPVDFSFSPGTAEIGTPVRFQVSDSRIIPIRWEFGGANCDDESTFDCSFAEDYCRDITWEYAKSGWKSVHLVAEQGEATNSGEPLRILPTGECCYKDGKPRAAFTVTPNPVLTGETVSFVDASSKASGPAKTESLSFSWSPVQPKIGEMVVFSISGGTIDSATWNFGEPGCGDAYPATSTCIPTVTDCRAYYFIYASAGTKTVRLTLGDGETATRSLTVLDEGTCDAGGGGTGGGGDDDDTCTYSLSPTSHTFPEEGGNLTVNVTTQAGCAWTATKSVSWISITSGASGTSSGSFSYRVATNSGSFRSTIITAGGKKHSVSQAAYEEPQDTAPTEWHWTVSLNGETVVESDQPDFTTSFRKPGMYDVRLEVSNCAGSSVESGFLQVDQAPVVIPESYVVPSAVHTPGHNDTSWRTDLRVFNPDEYPVVLNILYQPENTDNSVTFNQGIEVTIQPHGTSAADDILQLIPGVIGNDDGSGSFKGALSISYTNTGEETVPPMVISRTYNETPDGSFGQFVPAASAMPSGDGEFFLSGLVSNSYYRSNVRMANLGDEPITVTLELLDWHGGSIGEPVYKEILPKSTAQVNGMAAAAGVNNGLPIFSVRASCDSDDFRIWASVVDNSTGDPVLYAPMLPEDESTTLWIPGLAHLPGANGSQWRSDVVFFNPGTEDISAMVRYIASENLGIVPYMDAGLKAGAAAYFVDILGESLLPSGVESKGYLKVEAVGDSRLPAVAAKTYNWQEDGGTFGQNLFVFQDRDLVEEGVKCYLPGVSTAEHNTEGFRTNIGILNTDETDWTSISLKALDEAGAVLGQIDIMWLQPAQFLQFGLADKLNLHDRDHVLTVEIEVLEGGPIAAYASQVDNRTQDPILIPAQKVLRKEN